MTLYAVDEFGLAVFIFLGLFVGGAIGVLSQPRYRCIIKNRMFGPKFAVMRLLEPTRSWRIKVVNVKKTEFELDGKTYIMPSEEIDYTFDGFAPTFACMAVSTEAGKWQIKQLNLTAPTGVTRDAELVSIYLLKQKQKQSALGLIKQGNLILYLVGIVLLVAAASAFFAYLSMDKSSAIASYLSQAAQAAGK